MEASGGRTIQEEKSQCKGFKGGCASLVQETAQRPDESSKKIMRWEDPDDLWHEIMADSGEAGRPDRRLLSECREGMLVAWTRVIAVEVVRTCMCS